MAYLVLENGMTFPGKRIGARKDAQGELVFHTGVVDYVETLTSPENAGLMVVQTFPVAGNYGVTEEDGESDYTPAAFVVRSLCDTPSNFRSEMGLEEFLVKKGIPGLAGVDTRRLTAVLRAEGTMQAMIVDEVPEKVTFAREKVPFLPGKEAFFPSIGEKNADVVLWDLGAKRSLVQKLRHRGWDVNVLPMEAKAADILEKNPDFVVLSGGPGCPEAYEKMLPEIKKLMGNVPLLSVGMGHLLCAQAMGASLYKMKAGHRGQNQPAFCTLDGRTYVTGQSHGYAVENSSISCGEMIYKNLNDDTCEGILYEGKRCFSVQFDPDEGVLGRFAAWMGGEKNA